MGFGSIEEELIVIDQCNDSGFQSFNDSASAIGKLDPFKGLNKNDDLITLDDDDLIVKLPDTTGMKDEILIQSRQRYHYERCLTYAGAKLIEFGNKDLVTSDDLEKSITDKTVAVHYVANETINDPNALSLEETIEVAKSNNLYVMVDAAGQIYPLENLSKYSNMGAEIGRAHV